MKTTTDEVLDDAVAAACRNQMIEANDLVVITAGVVGGARNATNLMTVRRVEND
ncbi:MAG: hypothetical protein KDE50_26860, partial [Caldilineaceae bacterium]|nr:hypothetical protein [Caldilineaceae bacterium]